MEYVYAAYLVMIAVFPRITTPIVGTNHLELESDFGFCEVRS